MVFQNLLGLAKDFAMSPARRMRKPPIIRVERPRTMDDDPVVKGILKAISQKRLRPGLKLGEARLANAFDTTRIHVRQALAHLASRRIVAQYANRGAFADGGFPYPDRRARRQYRHLGLRQGGDTANVAGNRRVRGTRLSRLLARCSSAHRRFDPGTRQARSARGHENPPQRHREPPSAGRGRARSRRHRYNFSGSRCCTHWAAPGVIKCYIGRGAQTCGH